MVEARTRSFLDGPEIRRPSMSTKYYTYRLTPEYGWCVFRPNAIKTSKPIFQHLDEMRAHVVTQSLNNGLKQARASERRYGVGVR